MKTLRSICKTNNTPFLEFDKQDIYWTNGHLIIKNDSNLIKSINKAGVKNKGSRQEFYFEGRSKGFKGLKTTIVTGRKSGLLKECLNLVKTKGIELKEIRFPEDSPGDYYFKDRNLKIGLISEKDIIIGINKDYHEYVSNIVKGGHDKIIAGIPISYVKEDSIYAIVGPQMFFFDKDFNNSSEVSTYDDFVKFLYGDEHAKYFYDFLPISQKYIVSQE